MNRGRVSEDGGVQYVAVVGRYLRAKTAVFQAACGLLWLKMSIRLN